MEKFQLQRIEEHFPLYSYPYDRNRDMGILDIGRSVYSQLKENYPEYIEGMLKLNLLEVKAAYAYFEENKTIDEIMEEMNRGKEDVLLLLKRFTYIFTKLSDSKDYERFEDIVDRERTFIHSNVRPYLYEYIMTDFRKISRSFYDRDDWMDQMKDTKVKFLKVLNNPEHPKYSTINYIKEHFPKEYEACELYLLTGLSQNEIARILDQDQTQISITLVTLRIILNDLDPKDFSESVKLRYRRLTKQRKRDLKSPSEVEFTELEIAKLRNKYSYENANKKELPPFTTYIKCIERYPVWLAIKKKLDLDSVFVENLKIEDQIGYDMFISFYGIDGIFHTTTELQKKYSCSRQLVSSKIQRTYDKFFSDNEIEVLKSDVDNMASIPVIKNYKKKTSDHNKKYARYTEEEIEKLRKISAYNGELPPSITKVADLKKFKIWHSLKLLLNSDNPEILRQIEIIRSDYSRVFEAVLQFYGYYGTFIKRSFLAKECGYSIGFFREKKTEMINELLKLLEG